MDLGKPGRLEGCFRRQVSAPPPELARNVSFPKLNREILWLWFHLVLEQPWIHSLCRDFSQLFSWGAFSWSSKRAKATPYVGASMVQGPRASGDVFSPETASQGFLLTVVPQRVISQRISGLVWGEAFQSMVLNLAVKSAPIPEPANSELLQENPNMPIYTTCMTVF